MRGPGQLSSSSLKFLTSAAQSAVTMAPGKWNPMVAVRGAASLISGDAHSLTCGSSYFGSGNYAI